MKINRKEFQTLLERVRPGLASKEIIEQSTSYVFKDGQVFTYNDSVAVSAPLPNGKALGLEGAIEATRLYKVISDDVVTADELEVEMTDKHLKLQAPRREAKVARESKVTLPLEELKYPMKWIKINPEITEAIRACLFSVGKDMTRPKLTCIHITPDKIESCDDFRATVYPMDTQINDPIMLPGAAARTLIGYKITGYNETGGWLHFIEGDTGIIFSTRTYSEDYPNLDAMLEEPGETYKLPDDISALLTGAGVFADGDYSFDERVQLSLKKGELVVKGIDDYGQFTGSSRMRYKGEPVSVYVNPDILREIVDKAGEMGVGENLLVFSTESFNHYVRMLKG
jgi:hypothetical protein